jgi:two-component system chemotaxis response regulator CheY
MTKEETALAELASMVAESTREELRTLGIESTPGASTEADGRTEGLAAFVALFGPDAHGDLVVQTTAGLLQRAAGADDAGGRGKLGRLAGEVAGRVAAACRARGLELRAGTPRIVSGVGLAVSPGASGGRLDLASEAGPIGVAFGLHLGDGASLRKAQTILVIDDSPAIRKEVAALLGAAGYAVVEAGDGLEGLARIADHPDLAMVFCDINMPNMDGIAFVEKVKGPAADDGLPIVMLTSETRAKLCRQALQKGAVGWIVKPFQPPEILATVQKLARRA